MTKYGENSITFQKLSQANVSANPDVSTPRIYTENSISCQCKMKELTFKDFEDVPKGLSVCPRLPVFCNIRFHMISCVMYSVFTPFSGGVIPTLLAYWSRSVALPFTVCDSNVSTDYIWA